MAFGSLAALLTAFVMVLSDGGILFTSPFWVDEWLMVFEANRSSPLQILEDLAAGADGGTPLVHLAYWLLRQLTGPLTPTVVRAFSLACMLLAMTVAFAILRRRFSMGPSIVGSLAIGSHPLVVAHAYEGRFYGPWLLCAVIVAWFLAQRQSARARANAKAGRRTAIGLGVAAFALCTVHPYGVISLGILLLGGLAAYGTGWRNGLRDIAPAAYGLSALLVVVPLALGQRSAYTVRTWIPDFAPGQLTALAIEFWLATIGVVAAMLLLIATLARRFSGQRVAVRTIVHGVRSDPSLIALFATATMPIALAVVSLVGQPSMLPRYAILSTLALAPLAALAAEVGGRWAARGLFLVVLWLWFAAYVREGAAEANFAAGVRRITQTYEHARPANLPIVLYSIHLMYPLIGDEPSEIPVRFMDIPDSRFPAAFHGDSPAAQYNRGFILERDLARIHATHWGFPKLAPLSALDSTSRFLLLGPVGRLPAGFRDIDHFARSMFPGHRVTRLLPDLTLLERDLKASSK
ncbi:MAG: hypothetical protein ACREOK_15455 [Gemmatimonadaceae bacterium]